MKNIIGFCLALFLSHLCVAQTPLNVAISHDLENMGQSQFDVELSVSDFRDLYTFQIFLNWDESLYRIDNVSFLNTEIPAFTEDNIVLPNEDASIPDPGKVRVVWGDAAPLSLTDGTVLVRLQFTALGQPCDFTEFSFGDIGSEESEKLQASILDVNSGSFVNVGVAGSPKNIQIPGQGCLSTTTDLYAATEVSLFPNPAFNTVNVNIENPVDNNGGYIHILSQDGRSIGLHKIGNDNHSLDITNLDGGIYMYQIFDDNKILDQGNFTKLK